MFRIPVLLFCLMFMDSSFATDLTLPVKVEIENLLNLLEKSGCQFNRNGNWYSAYEAKAHLTRKLEYFDQKGEVSSTEQFISLAASKSTLSGQAYLVKCQGTVAMESSKWLNQALDEMRRSVNTNSR